MGNSFYGYAPHSPQLCTDIVIELLSNVFLEGRFLSLFAMLFGAGIYIHRQKYSSLPMAATDPIKSRLHWLIGIGLVHGIVIFSGDILLAYGLCGLLAYYYYELSTNALIQKACWFIAIALLMISLITLTIEDEPYYRGSALFNEQLSVWTGSYFQQLLMQGLMVGYMLVITPLTLLWYGTGLMLIGMALIKQGYFESGFSRSQLSIMAISGVAFSIIDSGLSLTDSLILNELSNLFMMISALPVALIYLHIIVKLCQNNPLKLTLLQNLGKLSLSFYILQSIVGTITFRHLYPQWQSSFDRIDYMLFAIIFSLFQLGLAALYLRYFNQGPLEKLLVWLSQRNHKSKTTLWS
ncbi:DUF418 domain-containing protein [Shewanella aestuarii]|uniref:DUF418 domain-containing protein n=1 Tax=Shewanella aestuarii TaxID=1028752 RepID=A0A6G9QL88_9GAMM|nr:DUF418 domain-containing protein [Shewanella aestuarii]QIR15340.1 DUF418 domain-containing protein [Shewanella aestuarii]